MLMLSCHLLLDLASSRFASEQLGTRPSKSNLQKELARKLFPFSYLLSALELRLKWNARSPGTPASPASSPIPSCAAPPLSQRGERRPPPGTSCNHVTRPDPTGSRKLLNFVFHHSADFSRLFTSSSARFSCSTGRLKTSCC